MNPLRSRVYTGRVVHRRRAPRAHAFSYRVFALALDLDEIDAVAGRLRLFARGRGGLFSFHDGDVGRPGPEPIAMRTRSLLAEAGLGRFASRIELLTYPRLFGYVFNPLSVYFCHDDDGRLGAVLYEVTNTFQERKCYVIPLDPGEPTACDGPLRHACAKEMYVSPFTDAQGTYSFHLRPPGEAVTVGVALRSDGKPVLDTCFHATRRPLTDRTLAMLAFGYPLMTLKVTVAIHLEAVQLWAKGVPVVARHSSPKFSYSVTEQSARGSVDA
jgi:DUF1365 family protein